MWLVYLLRGLLNESHCFSFQSRFSRLSNRNCLLLILLAVYSHCVGRILEAGIYFMYRWGSHIEFADVVRTGLVLPLLLFRLTKFYRLRDSTSDIEVILLSYEKFEVEGYHIYVSWHEDAYYYFPWNVKG